MLQIKSKEKKLVKRKYRKLKTIDVHLQKLDTISPRINYWKFIFRILFVFFFCLIYTLLPLPTSIFIGGVGIGWAAYDISEYFFP